MLPGWVTSILIVLAEVVAFVSVFAFMALLGRDGMIMLGLMAVVFGPIILLILTGIAAIKSRQHRGLKHYDKSELTSLGLED